MRFSSRRAPFESGTRAGMCISQKRRTGADALAKLPSNLVEATGRQTQAKADFDVANRLATTDVRTAKAAIRAARMKGLHDALAPLTGALDALAGPDVEKFEHTINNIGASLGNGGAEKLAAELARPDGNDHEANDPEAGAPADNDETNGEAGTDLFRSGAP